MAEIIVVAFGGNAVLRAGQAGTLEDQRRNVRAMARELAGLVVDGYRLVVVHGNGPQVGNLQLQQELAAPEVPAQPLFVCGAMTQGQLGYLIVEALHNALAEHGLDVPLATIVTRTLIDADDPAFVGPAKPIGPFYAEERARRLAQARGWTVAPDSQRGWRRVVASPRPLDVLEWPAVKALVEAGVLVLAGGGGGVPVIRRPNGAIEGVEAVIDKDLCAELLATRLGASVLLLLTGVERVAVAFGTPWQRDLAELSLADLERYAAEGHFPLGSMGPKMAAAAEFLRHGGRRVVVASPEQACAALAGRAGTTIQTETVGGPV